VKTKLFYLFLVSVFAWGCLLGCENREKAAAAMIAMDHELILKGDWGALRERLYEVIEQYPDTMAAAQARESLEKMTERFNRTAELALRSAYAMSLQCFFDSEDSELSMARLREKGLQAFEGVEIRVARSDPQDYLITSEHQDGDTVYSVGNDGRIIGHETE
jgi:hypothetical protein